MLIYILLTAIARSDSATIKDTKEKGEIKMKEQEKTKELEKTYGVEIAKKTMYKVKYKPIAGSNYTMTSDFESLEGIEKFLEENFK